MKYIKFYLTLFIVTSSSIMYSQDTIKIEEIVISKEIKIKKLLDKLKNNLIKNSDTTNYTFRLVQKSYINNDTLMTVDENIKLKINSFNNKFQRQYSDSLKSKLIEINERHFRNYIEESSPLRWVSDYPVRKNLNIINLDFFKNYRDYSYKLEKANEEKSVISFTSDSLYHGKIIFNPKTNMPITIEYSNSLPYTFSHTSVKNLNSTNQFESEWSYIYENSLINFFNINGSLSIKNMVIEENIENFEYNIVNKSKKIIFHDKNDFRTSIKLDKIESIKNFEQK